MSEHYVQVNSQQLDRRTASLHVQSIGRQQCLPGQGWGPGILDHHLICHVVSGKGVYLLKGRQYPLSAGDTFLIYPDTSIHYYADRQDPWEYICVGFGGSDASFFIDHTDFTSETPVLHQFHSEAVAALMEHIVSTAGSNLSHCLAITGHLYLLLAFLMEHSSKKLPAEAEEDDCAKLVADYIITHYEQPITVEEMAAYASVSHSSLYRSFKRRFQVSPKRFLLEHRIERACFLLSNSNYSVQEISTSVGFEDPFYFSRAFKAIKGVPPRQYAAQYRAANSGEPTT